MSPRVFLPKGSRQSLFLLACSLALVAFVGEIVARLVLGAPLPWKYPQVRYRSDPNLIFSLIPNESAYSADKPLTLNSRGFRGPEIGYSRKPGVLRILFLGDSIAFGTGVRNEEVVTARVKDLLALRGIRAEVINTAVPSYNLSQEVAFLRHEGIRYQPDWVVVGMCWNDINDKTCVKVSADGWLISRGASEKTGLQRYFDSELVYELRNIMKKSRLAFAVTQGTRALHASIFPDEHSRFRTGVLEGVETPRIVEGWRHIEEAMRELRTISEGHGARPLLVTFPVPIALERSFPHSSYPDKALSIAEKAGIPSIDLEPLFRSRYRGHDSLFIPYDGDHPNASGHDIAARAIVAYLLSVQEGALTKTLSQD